MERIRVSLTADTPALANEFSDVLKLFFVVESFGVNDPLCEGEPLSQRFTEESGVARCTFTFRGKSLSREASLPEDPAVFEDEEHRQIVLKRLRKRLCKGTLYALLKSITTHQPP